MTTIYDNIRHQMTTSMKNKDKPRINIFRFLKGNLDQLDDPQNDVAATKTIRSYLKQASLPNSCFDDYEVEVMKSLIPVLLNAEQTKALIFNDLEAKVMACELPRP